VEFLGAGLFVISLLGWSVLAQKLFHTNRQVSFFIGIQLLILGLYIAALLQVLLFGVYLLEGIGIVVLVKTFYTERRFIRFPFPISKSFYIIPFLAFTTTIPKDFRFTMSDEFPSWAANVKTMFAENSLAGMHSATRTIADGFYQSYPPFQQLFQYLFLRNTFWSESNVQIAQNILALSLLLGAVGFILHSRPTLIFPAWIGAISFYFLFGFTMSNLLADGLLAVQFAACLGLAISIKDELREYLLLGLLIGNLILIKPTGFVLAFCAVTLIIIMLASSADSSRAKLLPVRVLFNLRTHWKNLATVITLPSITYLSWQIHLHLIQMTPGTENFSFSNLGTVETRARWSKTWASYKQNFFGSLYGQDNLAGVSSTAPNVVRVCHISLFMIFIILATSQFILVFAKQGEERKVAIKIAYLVIFLAIFYQAFLLLLYMFFFGEYEGIRSAALVRYSASFFLGWTILVFTQFIRMVSHYRYSEIASAAFASCLLLIAPSSLASEVQGKYTDLTKLPARMEVEKMVSKSINLVPRDKKIYYVYQGSNGFEKYIFSYLVLPRQTNWSCTSLGKPLFEGDVWTCDQALPKVLKGYDYMVMGKSDTQFWDANSRYLTPGSLPTTRGIFRISGAEGALQLVPIN
jgi:hypothetical protein